jgi:hypothetical protein
MEEAPENSKELSHSAHANRIGIVVLCYTVKKLKIQCEDCSGDGSAATCVRCSNESLTTVGVGVGFMYIKTSKN